MIFEGKSTIVPIPPNPQVVKLFSHACTKIYRAQLLERSHKVMKNVVFSRDKVQLDPAKVDVM